MNNITLVEYPIRAQSDGAILVRIMAIETQDGIARTLFNHLMRLEPGVDIDVTVQALVEANNQHLGAGIVPSDGEKRQFPAMSEAAVQAIKDKASEVWTPPVLEWWEKRRAALQEADETLQSDAK